MMAKETYTLVKAADRSTEHFPDAKSAAEAFSKTNAAENPCAPGEGQKTAVPAALKSVY